MPIPFVNLRYEYTDDSLRRSSLRYAPDFLKVLQNGQRIFVIFAVASQGNFRYNIEKTFDYKEIYL